MRALPFDLRFELGDHKVHLVHGSPRKVNEYLFEDKPARLYERLAAAETDDVLVFGHTHKPWIHEYGGVLFVNCGSVGKPKDGDPRGAFAILELDETGHVRASIERVPYDADAVAREVAARRACPRSTRRSWSQPRNTRETRGRDDEVRAVRVHSQRGPLADGPGTVRANVPERLPGRVRGV